MFTPKRVRNLLFLITLNLLYSPAHAQWFLYKDVKTIPQFIGDENYFLKDIPKLEELYQSLLDDSLFISEINQFSDEITCAQSPQFLSRYGYESSFHLDFKNMPINTISQVKDEDCCVLSFMLLKGPFKKYKLIAILSYKSALQQAGQGFIKHTFVYTLKMKKKRKLKEPIVKDRQVFSNVQRSAHL